jgi:hypothetical protein
MFGLAVRHIVRREHHDRKRRQRQCKGLAKAVHRDGLGVRTTEIADVAASVMRGVGVEQLAVKPPFRHADSVGLAHNRAEIGDSDHAAIGMPNAAEDVTISRISSGASSNL